MVATVLRSPMTAASRTTASSRSLTFRPSSAKDRYGSAPVIENC